MNRRQRTFLDPEKLLRACWRRIGYECIFYGPPDRENDVAQLIAQYTKSHLINECAGVGVRKSARSSSGEEGCQRRQATFFLDEIHRFNGATGYLLGMWRRG